MIIAPAAKQEWNDRGDVNAKLSQARQEQQEYQEG
jgi:hypothetical protein